MKYPTLFAAWLTGQLERHYLTPHRLAQLIAVDPHLILAYLHGQKPRPENCLRLANFLHQPLAVVYAMAEIPLKASWELLPDDWYEPPDLPLSWFAQCGQLLYQESFTDQTLAQLRTLYQQALGRVGGKGGEEEEKG